MTIHMLQLHYSVVTCYCCCVQVPVPVLRTPFTAYAVHTSLLLLV